MADAKLLHDPYNVIITGVGGQGNVLASRMVGDMLVRKGYEVTIGETFGASQRGGSVMSHLRVSAKERWSPQIPLGKAHLVASLEPVEALRVLKSYGNPGIKVITNLRPTRPMSVIAGDESYPGIEELKGWIRELSSEAWFLDVSEEAAKLGNPIFANVMLVGAMAAVGDLPLDLATFEEVVSSRMPESKVAVNLEAFEIGRRLLGLGTGLGAAL